LFPFCENVFVPGKSPIKVQSEMLDIFLGELYTVYMDRGRVYLRVVNVRGLTWNCTSVSPANSHSTHHPSPETSAIGQIVADVPSGFSLTPPQDAELRCCSMGIADYVSVCVQLYCIGFHCFTTYFGLHGYLQVCRIFYFHMLEGFCFTAFFCLFFTWSHTACFPFVFCSCAVFLR
jgi:hypothetical protein